MKLINEQRALGCQCGDTYFPPALPLVWNNLLEKASQKHSNYMYSTHKFSHTGRGSSSPSLRITKEGYIWEICAENIAYADVSEKSVINLWIKSPHHCANIMNSSLKEMGVSRKGSYWTQDFGTKFK